MKSNFHIHKIRFITSYEQHSFIISSIVHRFSNSLVKIQHSNRKIYPEIMCLQAMSLCDSSLCDNVTDALISKIFEKHKVSTQFANLTLLSFCCSMVALS